MRSLWNAIALLVISVLLMQPAGASAQAVDPIEVVRNYIATANTGDFDKTFTFYAEGAVVRNAVGLYVGRDAIGDWLREDVQTTRATPDKFQVVNGSTVINTGMVSLARFEQLGLGQTQYRAEYIIEGDKIKYFSPSPILTPEQQAKLRAATPAIAPPAIDPIEVVRNYIATANTGDFDKTFTFYAEGAVVRNAVGLYVGRDAIGDWLREDVQTTRATPDKFQVVNGSTVINTGMVSLARFEQLGLGQTQYRAEYIIEGDKIKYFSPSPILTPEQHAKLQAASAGRAGQGAPAALPRTGTGTGEGGWVVGLALLLIAGGLLTKAR